MAPTSPFSSSFRNIFLFSLVFLHASCLLLLLCPFLSCWDYHLWSSHLSKGLLGLVGGGDKIRETQLLLWSSILVARVRHWALWHAICPAPSQAAKTKQKLTGGQLAYWVSRLHWEPKRALVAEVHRQTQSLQAVEQIIHPLRPSLFLSQRSIFPRLYMSSAAVYKKQKKTCLGSLLSTIICLYILM